MTAPLTDAAQRERIRQDTNATLFVNAGAGSGKTTALVQRILTLVLTDGVRLANIAAVTFTEKAGAELRDRLRVELEAVRREGDPSPVGTRTAAADEALDDLDSAAIGTLHAFAQRVLAAHPIQAGLPPLIEVLDEVGSSVAFDERWAGLQSELLDDDAVAQPLLLGLAAGMNLKHVRSLALVLGRDWDLIEERVLSSPAPEVRVPDLPSYSAALHAFLANRQHCRADDDKLLPKFAVLADLVESLDTAADGESKLVVLQAIGEVKFSYGQKGNWSVPIAEIKEQGTALVSEALTTVAGVLDQCLRQITQWTARRVLDAAQVRRSEGALEFHDLLVLSRDLLRRNASV